MGILESLADDKGGMAHWSLEPERVEAYAARLEELGARVTDVWRPRSLLEAHRPGRTCLGRLEVTGQPFDAIEITVLSAPQNRGAAGFNDESLPYDDVFIIASPARPQIDVRARRKALRRWVIGTKTGAYRWVGQRLAKEFAEEPELNAILRAEDEDEIRIRYDRLCGGVGVFRRFAGARTVLHKGREHTELPAEGNEGPIERFDWSRGRGELRRRYAFPSEAALNVYRRIVERTRTYANL
jgi:hypothetical protein